MSAASDGSDGVIAAQTVLSHVDGARGRLIFRGHDIEELAGHVQSGRIIRPQSAYVGPMPKVAA